MLKGRIFDIKRFATHDGKGIRTTVFMKGCPLHCIWCQNPEGISYKVNLVYFKNKCIGCHRCIEVCKNHAITAYNSNIEINKDKCIMSGNCIDICPVNALVKDTNKYGVGELVEEIKKDEIFFKYGGGVTLSGGEPLLQSSFVIALFEKLKTLGIHTAIETSLYADEKIIKRVADIVDEIYCDFKVYSDKDHIRYTGRSNNIIKKNISYLLTSHNKEKVTIRTPLIPQFTAKEENIKDIAGYISKLYIEVKYELLNYNPLASSKYEYTDMEYCFDINPKMYRDNEIKHFQNIAINSGIKNVVIP